MIAALITSTFLHIAASGTPPAASLHALDSPAYWSQTFRDSAASYRGRLEIYHQEYYSYDIGTTLAMLPIAGEAYVHKFNTGVLFSAAGLASGATSIVGAVRLIKGSPNTGLNVGLLVGGIVGVVLFKWWEVTDVLHTISRLDEELVEKWRVATEDIEPGSIRYPTKDWPDWVTSKKPAREPERPRDAFGAVTSK